MCLIMDVLYDVQDLSIPKTSLFKIPSINFFPNGMLKDALANKFKGVKNKNHLTRFPACILCHKCR